MPLHCVMAECSRTGIGFSRSTGMIWSCPFECNLRLSSGLHLTPLRQAGFRALCIRSPRKILLHVPQRQHTWILSNISATAHPGAVTRVVDNGIAVAPSSDHVDFTASVGEAEDGPQELEPNITEIDPFAMPEATPLQTVASVALTGAITVLLLRSLRRRSKRAKELKFRANAVERPEKKAPEPVLSEEEEKPPPSVLSTLGGAAVAASISFVLYNFTIGLEDQFSLKAVSNNYSVRNLTITVRTIITGLCWLATFVFGANSIGLTLYGLQLALGLSSESSEVLDEKKTDILPDSDVETKR